MAKKWFSYNRSISLWVVAICNIVKKGSYLLTNLVVRTTKKAANIANTPSEQSAPIGVVNCYLSRNVKLTDSPKMSIS